MILIKPGEVVISEGSVIANGFVWNGEKSGVPAELQVLEWAMDRVCREASIIVEKFFLEKKELPKTATK